MWFKFKYKRNHKYNRKNVSMYILGWRKPLKAEAIKVDWQIWQEILKLLHQNKQKPSGKFRRYMW